MRTLFHRKKFLFIALLEDAVALSFLFTVLASSMEILLPGSLSQKIPLALIFTSIISLVFLYIHSLQKEKLPLPSLTIHPVLFHLLLLVLFFIGLFMTRAFGLWGALFQIILLAVTLYYWLSRNSSDQASRSHLK